MTYVRNLSPTAPLFHPFLFPKTVLAKSILIGINHETVFAINIDITVLEIYCYVEFDTIITICI